MFDAVELAEYRSHHLDELIRRGGKDTVGRWGLEWADDLGWDHEGATLSVGRPPARLLLTRQARS